MTCEELQKLLSDFGQIGEESFYNVSWNVEALSFPVVRDKLMILGMFLFEDTDKQIYIVSIKGGFRHKNSALVAVHMDGNSLKASVFAKEGLIHQNTGEGILNELENAFSRYIKEDN